MSSIPFERYNDEFSSLSSQIQSSLSALQTSMDASQTNASELNLAQNLLTQAKDLLKQMSVEARGCDDAALKEQNLHAVRVAKAKLANMTQDVQAVQSENDRLNLTSGGRDVELGPSNVSQEAKSRLLATNNALSNQNDTLDHARRIMADTEEVAMEITSELERNRETIGSAHSRVRGVSGLTNRARRILVSMQRREMQQKMVVYAVGLVCFVVVLVLLGAFD